MAVDSPNPEVSAVGRVALLAVVCDPVHRMTRQRPLVVEWGERAGVEEDPLGQVVVVVLAHRPSH